ncbi:MerR family transcriptional regulator [Falsibacillus pallidus]|uniref:Methanogenic corrinoid protein MtbC1 n=1 Tax=Falsibacillus pallidus TaxID=493781 RepID=A0A370GKT4_9BACI|nr:cobalamin-dependent protein [Falsibacillus pallidus]RDI42964.1 methanogenic corrinoid protein MtbC1 [Falsibacillus pallidus]
MSNQNIGKYNIKAVCTMLGIQAGTLRAWERRYNIIAPVRNESGHRLYTEQHVKILKWLVNKVNQGFTISQAIALLDKNEIENEQDMDDKGTLNSDQLSEELLRELMNFNETRAQELINRAFAVYTMDKVLIDILAGLLVRIGDLWEKGKITTAHEHFASSILRSRIGILMHSFPHNGILPKVVAVCSPGEWHELGLLIFTLFVRRKGFDVIYLGSSIKEEDLFEVLETVNPKFLFMSCTMKENLPRALKLVDTLIQDYPGTHVGIGGSAVDRMEKSKSDQYQANILGLDKQEWDSWLKSKME